MNASLLRESHMAEQRDESWISADLESWITIQPYEPRRPFGVRRIEHRVRSGVYTEGNIDEDEGIWRNVFASPMSRENRVQNLCGLDVIAGDACTRARSACTTAARDRRACRGRAVDAFSRRPPIQTAVADPRRAPAQRPRQTVQTNQDASRATIIAFVRIPTSSSARV
jgi:hypothetical protein